MMKNYYDKFIDSFPAGKVLLNEPIAKYCSFRLGGPADLFFKATNTDELVSAVNKARELSIPHMILGGGTNILAGDLGYKGLIIKNESGQIKLKGIIGKKNIIKGQDTSSKSIFLHVDSGVLVNRLVRYTLDQGFVGLEAFLGQPGTVGGAVYINAHNMKMKVFFGDFVYSAKILSGDGKISEVNNEYFNFGYDQSKLQKTKEIILSVVLKLGDGNSKQLWDIAQSAYDYRMTTQPHGIYSAGCTFRNIDKYQAIRLSTPGYTCSAGLIIDQLGLKGKSCGQASFSPQHANFIIHKGSASASDVLKLINLAKQKAKERYNLDLKEEIVIFGDFKDG